MCSVCALHAQIARAELGTVGLSEFHNKRARVRACMHWYARACGRGSRGVSKCGVSCATEALGKEKRGWNTMNTPTPSP